MITRFAPAPTGYLHIGHVLNAIYVWGVARRIGARVMLRIEDHDRQRSRPAFEDALREDLTWLGFMPEAESRQSDRTAIYDEALARLRAAGLTYACGCTRRDSAGERYSGRCRERSLAETPGHGIRVRIEAGEERFDDLRLGPQLQTPADQSGDVLLRDRLGCWTYQFAATVDDFAQGVTHVIRGEDLLSSTGRQIRLARLLGRDAPPAFLHHALLMKTPLQKISKSDGDTGVRDLRAAGWRASEVIGHAAALGGLIESPRDLHADEVSTLSFRGI
ncbi:MAG: glutamate--tRNA ligase family protein [Acidobacteriota bacterium]|nr:glutamate--tRNA ligase family protein [Acidobacteriota bacterium]